MANKDTNKYKVELKATVVGDCDCVSDKQGDTKCAQDVSDLNNIDTSSYNDTLQNIVEAIDESEKAVVADSELIALTVKNNKNVAIATITVVVFANSEEEALSYLNNTVVGVENATIDFVHVTHILKG